MKTEEMEPFNKYGEDLSYNGTECSFLYESDSMPVATNKQKLDEREGTLGNVRNGFGQEPFTRMGVGERPRRIKDEKEASDSVKKEGKVLGETTLSSNEQKHSVSNKNHQLRISGIESCFQRVTLPETFGAADGVTNKNCREGEFVRSFS